MPAFLKASGDANVTFKLENSSGVISGIAIPAANGSPKEDSEVNAPKAKACAFRCAVLNKTPKAAVMAVVRQDNRVLDVVARDIGLDLICMFAVYFLWNITEWFEFCR
jgi:hypothetical protein